MNDHEKIADVVGQAEHPDIYGLPSYTYLVRFLKDVGVAYAEETHLRKQLAMSNLAWMALSIFLALTAIVGWIR